MSGHLYIVTLDFDRSCEEIADELRALADAFEPGGDMTAHDAMEKRALGVKLFRLHFLAEMAKYMRSGSADEVVH